MKKRHMEAYYELVNREIYVRRETKIEKVRELQEERQSK